MISKHDFDLDTLDPAIALLLDTQAILCGHANQAEAPRADTAPAQAITPAGPNDVDTRKARDLIDRQSRSDRKRVGAATRSAALLEELIALPAPLLEPAAEAVAGKGWSRLAPGIRCLELNLPSEAEVELYRIEPNCAVPRHTHDGSEFTLVVTGAFTDETGCFRAGDLAHKGPEDTHQPIANPGEVCYALAVREGDIKLTGFLGLVQKVLGG